MYKMEKPIIKDNVHLSWGDKSFMEFICFFTILSSFFFNFRYFFTTEKIKKIIMNEINIYCK